MCSSHPFIFAIIDDADDKLLIIKESAFSEKIAQKVVKTFFKGKEKKFLFFRKMPKIKLESCQKMIHSKFDRAILRASRNQNWDVCVLREKREYIDVRKYAVELIRNNISLLPA